MTIKQVIKLMRAGYTPAEIRELQEPDATLDLIEAGATKDTVQDWLDCIRDPDAVDETEPEQEQAQNPEPETDPAQDPEPDYKELYKQTQEQLKAAQAANNRQEITGSDQRSAADVINDYIKDNL